MAKWEKLSKDLTISEIRKSIDIAVNRLDLEIKDLNYRFKLTNLNKNNLELIMLELAGYSVQLKKHEKIN